MNSPKTEHSTYVDLPCEHPVPVFGCASCIQSERTNTLVAAKKETKAPPCPECGRAMVFCDGVVASMSLTYLCSAGFSQDGEALCDGEVEVKVR